MKSIFKSTFYLRSNYVNKEGKNRDSRYLVWISI